MNFTITLSENELNVVVAGLSKLPLEVALQPFENIRNQANQQASAAKQQAETPAE